MDCTFLSEVIGSGRAFHFPAEILPDRRGWALHPEEPPLQGEATLWLGSKDQNTFLKKFIY